MTAPRGLHDVCGDAGLLLTRSAPRAPGHLHVWLEGPDGRERAGQWFDDAQRCRSVARQTSSVWTASAGPPPVRVIGEHLMTQDAGADRKLARLAALAAEPGAALLVHRPERRGVVRHELGGRPVFTKVVRPDRAERVHATLALAQRLSAAPTPCVVHTDRASGTVTTAELPGVPLHELLSARLDVGGLAPRVGATLRKLHVRAGAALTPHTAADELATTRAWLTTAARHGVPAPDPGLVADLLRQAGSFLDSPPGRTTLVHRDLHDKQLVVGPGGPVGVLDLDLAVAGDPALDLANLAVHLELRAHQGLLPMSVAQALVSGITESYRPDAACRRTFRGYAIATRLRLQGVYAFRPRSVDAARLLLTRARITELT